MKLLDNNKIQIGPAVGALSFGLLFFSGCSRETHEPNYPVLPLTSLNVPNLSGMEIHGIISRVQCDVEWRVLGRSMEYPPEKGTLIWLKVHGSDNEYPLLLIESGLHRWRWRHSEILMQGTEESAIKASWSIQALITDQANMGQQTIVPAMGQWHAGKIGESPIF